MPGSLVILWWGGDLRILAPDGRLIRPPSAAPGAGVAAVLQAAAGERAGAAGARIIYHPDTLDLHEVSCPRTSRSRLGRILSREFPALAAPGAVWSAEPIRRGTREYATVLYADRAGNLPRLVAGLARGGLRVEGAWPLQSLIEATPPCDGPEARFLSLVSLEGRALISCVGPSGDRSLRFFDGDGFSDGALAAAAAGLARFDEGSPPPGLMVVEEGPFAAALSDALRTPSLNRMPLARFLENARGLPAAGFSDFLGHGPFLSRLPGRRRLATLAALAFLAGAAGVELTARRERERALGRAELLREVRERERRSEEDRAEAETAFSTLAGALSRVEGPARPHHRFLEALARTTPSEIALRSVSVEGAAILIRGRADGSSRDPGGPAAQLSRELSAAGAEWRFNPPVFAEGGDFTLAGSFEGARSQLLNSDRESRSRDLSPLRHRLQEERDQLPDAGALDSLLRSSFSGWKAEFQPGAPEDGLERRICRMVLEHPRIDAWPGILEATRALCETPGLRIDSLVLEAGPEDGDAFARVEIVFEATLKHQKPET